MSSLPIDGNYQNRICPSPQGQVASAIGIREDGTLPIVSGDVALISASVNGPLTRPEEEVLAESVKEFPRSSVKSQTETLAGSDLPIGELYQQETVISGQEGQLFINQQDDSYPAKKSDEPGLILAKKSSCKKQIEELPSQERFRMIASILKRQGKMVKESSRGTKIFDIGNGCLRHEFANGDVVIEGLKFRGWPVQVDVYGNVITWGIDSNKVCPGFEKDARQPFKNGQLPVKTSLIELQREDPALKEEIMKMIFRGMKLPDELSSGGICTKQIGVCRQYLPGQGGARLTTIEQSDGSGTLELFSDRELTGKVIRNIVETMERFPRKIFIRLPKIFIFDNIGEGCTKDGKEVYRTFGFSSPGGIIVLERDNLSDRSACDSVLSHEMGHLLDSINGYYFSERAVDAGGKKIFGEGKFVPFSLNDKGSPLLSIMPDLSKSDFLSKYAAASPSEDFAITFEFLIGLREVFNSVNPGKEYFDMMPHELHRDLVKRGLSPGIEKKIMAIIDYYRNLA